MADEKSKETVTVAKEDYVNIQTQINNLAQQASIAQAIAVKEKNRSEELGNLVNRMQADFDNYRKRTNEQIKKVRMDGAADSLEKILPLMDVLKKAISIITDEKVAEGVKMIYRQFQDVLSSQGVEEIPALGEQFDPNVHNAISRIKVNDEKMNNVIVEVAQKGYRMGDRVLRPSTVIVGTTD